MKSKLITALLILLLSLAGCSSGTKSNTPDDNFATVNKLMSAGYEMSDNQRQNIDNAVAEAKKMVAEGDIEEANRILKKTINMLELIAETDRFNKSE